MDTEGPQQPLGSIVPVGSVAGHVLDQAGMTRGILERVFSDLKPNTLRAYQHSWDVLAKYMNLPSRLEAAAAITKLEAGQANALAMNWVSSMRKEAEEAKDRGEHGVMAATISARLAALKGITKRLRIVGLINWHIEVKGPKVNRYKDTTGPGTDKVAKVAETLRARQDPKAIRDLAIIHALYTTGLRRGELANLWLEHLDFEKGRLWITGKARDDQESVTVPPKAIEAIQNWIKIRPGSSKHLFVSLDRHSHGNPLSDNGIWKITTSYGLGRPHGIRHSGITRVLDKSGGNIRMAQEFSRHKDPRTLMLYDDNRKDLAGEASKLLDQDL
jgi:integrase/recombinase XerC